MYMADVIAFFPAPADSIRSEGYFPERSVVMSLIPIFLRRLWRGAVSCPGNAAARGRRSIFFRVELEFLENFPRCVHQFLALASPELWLTSVHLNRAAESSTLVYRRLPSSGNDDVVCPELWVIDDFFLAHARDQR